MSEMRASPKTRLFLTGCHSFPACRQGSWWERANIRVQLFGAAEHRELALIKKMPPSLADWTA